MNPAFPESYYEELAELFGEEKARWARLPYEERMKELEWYHAAFNGHERARKDLSQSPRTFLGTGRRRMG